MIFDFNFSPNGILLSIFLTQTNKFRVGENKRRGIIIVVKSRRGIGNNREMIMWVPSPSALS